MSNEELAVRVQSGERMLLTQLWEQVERFVAQQAARWARAWAGTLVAEYDDLYQSGYLALVKAADSYQGHNGCSFISWLALHLKTAFAEAAGLRGSARQNDPLHRARSLDAPLGGDTEDVTLGDTVAGDNPIEDTERRVYLEQLHRALDAAMGKLRTEQSRTLHRRFYEGMTFAQTAQAGGFTVNDARRFESDGLRALRRPAISRELRQFIDDQTPYYARVGVAQFNTTGVSAVERAVFARESVAAQIGAR